MRENPGSNPPRWVWYSTVLFLIFCHSFNIPMLRQSGSITDGSELCIYGITVRQKTLMISPNVRRRRVIGKSFMQEYYGFWEPDAAKKYLQEAQNLQAHYIFRKARPTRQRERNCLSNVLLLNSPKQTHSPWPYSQTTTYISHQI